MVISGKGDNDKPFACSFLHNDEIKSAEQALSFAVEKKMLFRDWVDSITVFSEKSVSYDLFFFDKVNISSHYVRGLHWKE